MVSASRSFPGLSTLLLNCSQRILSECHNLHQHCCHCRLSVTILALCLYSYMVPFMGRIFRNAQTSTTFPMQCPATERCSSIEQLVLSAGCSILPSPNRTHQRCIPLVALKGKNKRSSIIVHFLSHPGSGGSPLI